MKLNTETVAVLLVEDNLGDARLVAAELDDPPTPIFHLRRVECLAEAVQRLSERSTDIILLDLALPDSEGLDTYRAIRRVSEAPVVVVTGFEDHAVAALSEGAHDSLIKGRFDGELLRRTLRSTLVRDQMRRALVARQEAFVSIIRAHPDGVVVIDAEGQVLYANLAAERLFGVPVAELVGHDFGYPLASRTTLVTIVQSRENGPVRLTAEFRTVDGEWLGAPASIVFVRDVSGFVREQAELDRALLEQQSLLAGAQFGLRPLSEFDPAAFDELCAAYGALLENALEARAFRPGADDEEKVNAFVDRLTALRPGPRDLIELHTRTMRQKLRDAIDVRAEAYIEEGRLLVLRLMGRLVSYYRPYCCGGAPTPKGN